MKKELTQHQVKNLLDYDSSRGFLRWSNNAHPVCKGKIAGTTMWNKYRAIRINGDRYMAHRIVWLMFYGSMPSNMIDHINGDKQDNRIENLRDVSHQENQQNLRKARKVNKTGFLGVHYSTAKKKYVASIRIGGKKTHIGYYDDAEIAHQAYLYVKRIYHSTCTI